MQVTAQAQTTPVPQKPNCLVYYAGDACDQLMQQYTQALEQHQRQEWQITVAAPLQKQIADQQKQIADQQNQIKTLQLQMESQSTAALQNDARNRAALDVIGAALGVGMALLVAFASFRRLARNPALPKRGPQRAASA
jgi:hypothetical protein